MSGRKTRHLKSYISNSGLKYVVNKEANIYHCRFPAELDGWDRLVNDVSNGIGTEGDPAIPRSIFDTVVVMG